MKNRQIKLLIGFVLLKLSINTFPEIPIFTFEIMMQTLLFEPFKWLTSITAFIGGFFIISRIIKEVLERIKMITYFYKEWKIITLILIGYIYVTFHNSYVALAALVLSCFYGYMDAKMIKKNYHYDN